MDLNKALWEVVRAVADNDCTCSIELADTMGCIFDCGGRVDFENYPTIRFFHTETCPVMKARAVIEYARTGSEPLTTLKSQKPPAYHVGDRVEYFRRGICYPGIIREDLGILKGAGRRYRITPPDGERDLEYFVFDVAERHLSPELV